jgi:small GTP-binding protein
MVGKTSLIRKFVMDRFSDDYISTLGTKVTKKTFSIPREEGIYDLTMMIWDVEGRQDNLQTNIESFNTSIPAGYLRGSEGIFLVFDLTRKETLKSIEAWYKGVVKEVGKEIPCTLLGNKNDLKKKMEVKPQDVDVHNRKFSFEVFYTSAKTGENVEDAFQKMANRILDNVSDK